MLDSLAREPRAPQSAQATRPQHPRSYPDVRNYPLRLLAKNGTEEVKRISISFPHTSFLSREPSVKELVYRGWPQHALRVCAGFV